MNLKEKKRLLKKIWKKDKLDFISSIGNSLGHSVALSGNGLVLAVGQPQWNPYDLVKGGGDEQGSVLIYRKKNDGSWNFERV